MRATASNRNIQFLMREFEAGTLDLTPAFQRRAVWTPEQSSHLIDTILNELPFPEIYIRTSGSAEGAVEYEVVDGQQRIHAILDFATNDLVLSGDNVSLKWQGKAFDDLSDEEKTAFWQYIVITRELQDASDADIRDLFRRLNISSIVLNDQEMRHSQYTGDFIQLMENLAEHPWWLDMRVVSVRQVRRMDDVEFISELFIQLMAGPQDKKKTLETYYEDYDLEFPDAEYWQQRFTATTDLIDVTLGVALTRKWSGRSDFYSLFGLFGRFVESGKKFKKAEREILQTTLSSFKRDVNQAKRRDNKKEFSENIHEYADAVTRAATDITRRVRRLEILEARVKRALSRA